MKLILLLTLAAGSTAALFAQTPPSQIEPKAGTWHTWVIPSPSQLRPSAPPDAKTTAAEIQMAKLLIAEADPDTMAQAAFWDAGAPGYRWLEMAYQQMQAQGLAATLVPRGMALMSVAIYDSMIAAWDAKYTYNRQAPSLVDPTIKPSVVILNAPSYPSEHAVAAGAASTVLAYLFPSQAETYADLAEEAARSRIFAGAALPSDIAAGLDLGRRVGQMVVAYGRTDGSDAVFTGSYPLSASQWGSPNPVTPLAGTWKPWVLTAGSDVRLPPPPAFGSPDFQAQIAMVKNFARTNASNHSAWFWQPSFLGPWLDNLNREIFENHLDTNAPRAARAYALQFTAMHDATIGCWDTKFTYLVLRPPQVDSTITPLFALPQHPSYPGGHSCASGAAAVVEDYLFPNDTAAINAMATDAGLSTFYAGIHAMEDLQGGASLGAKTGQAAVARAQTDGAQ
jgi:membrane-associated phospholipid phosphatase